MLKQRTFYQNENQFNECLTAIEERLDQYTYHPENFVQIKFRYTVLVGKSIETQGSNLSLYVFMLHDRSFRK